MGVSIKSGGGHVGALSGSINVASAPRVPNANISFGHHMNNQDSQAGDVTQMNRTTLSGGIGSKFPSNYTNTRQQQLNTAGNNKKLMKNFSAHPQSFFNTNQHMTKQATEQPAMFTINAAGNSSNGKLLYNSLNNIAG